MPGFISCASRCQLPICGRFNLINPVPKPSQSETWQSQRRICHIKTRPRRRPAPVQLHDNATLHAAGLYLIGNNTLDNNGFAGNTGGSSTWSGNSNFSFFGFTNAMISINDRSPNAVATVKFGHGHAIVDAASDFDRNLVGNNIHLLIDNYRYMLQAIVQMRRLETPVALLMQAIATGTSKVRLSEQFSVTEPRGRRVDRHNFTDYRVSRIYKTSGVVGFFGLYRRRRGNTDGTYRQMGLSVLDNAAANDLGGFKAGSPNSSIIAGTNLTGSQPEVSCLGRTGKTNTSALPAS